MEARLVNLVESKPVISLPEAVQLAKNLFGLETTKSNCKELVGYENRNFYMKGVLGAYVSNAPTEQEFVLKVINGFDSQNEGLADATVGVTNFLWERGIKCPTALPSVNGKFKELVHLPFHNEDDVLKPEQTRHVVYLYHYVPGVLFSSMKSSYSLDLFYDVGRFTGNVSFALKDFSDIAALAKRSIVWDVKNVLQLQRYEYLVKGKKEEKLTRNVFERLAKELVPSLKNCPSSVIHGDVNENNLLLEKDEKGTYYVSAIIDFGDIIYSHKVFEPTIAAAYMALQYYPKDPLETTGHTLAGFQSVYPLSFTELSLIPIAIAGRLVTSLLLGLHSFSIEPTNEYTLETQENGWSVLETLMNASEEEIFQTWRNIFTMKGVEWPQ